MNRILSLVVVGLIITTVSLFAAPGDTIVRDEFTGADQPLTSGTGAGTYGLSARTPDTANEPGGTWSAPVGGWGHGILSNSAWLNADTLATKSIASAGGYSKPSQLTISADLNVGWTNATTRAPGGLWVHDDPSTYYHGLGLGFFQAGKFYGLGLRSDDNGNLGYLFLHEGSSAGAAIVTAQLPWTGSPFDSSLFHHLSYTVDTATGGISDITLDGNVYADPVTSAFTALRTDAAGFYVNSWAGDTYGYVDNFQVMEKIPEPSTLACLALAGLLGLRQRRA